MGGVAGSTAFSASFDWLAEAVADQRYEMSLGAFGAVGHFPREARTSLDITVDRIVAMTDSASIAFDRREGLQAIAFETLSSDPEGWNHAVALCLPQEDARMSCRSQWTPLGPDTGAIDPAGRPLDCFDIGLDTLYADILIRPSSGVGQRQTAATVRVREITLDSLAAHYPDDVWVFETAIGRIETSQPRRRHILPSLLSNDLTHANAAPIPEGMVPLGYVFPPSPRHAQPDEAANCHAEYQRLLDRFGRPDLVRLKRAVERALDRGRPPEYVQNVLRHAGQPSRAELACIRIALRQRRWSLGVRDRPEWEEAYDRPLAESPAAPAAPAIKPDRAVPKGHAETRSLAQPA